LELSLFGGTTGGFMAILSLQSALDDVMEILEDQDILEGNDELVGAMACLEALIQGKANTFDGEPLYAKVLVGINLKV
jgi:hypothetical protein